MAEQVEQALRNIITILAEVNASPTDIVRLTWFVTDMELYRLETKAIGEGYRRVIGKHFPVMSVIGVHCLVERGALVEIEATAVPPT
jgi:enamine deaminase RidA (YjgF/YER057c/UK114 family)